jgi:hypothetical protein
MDGKKRIFMIGTGGVILFWGGLSLLAVMQGQDAPMQGTQAQVQGGPLQGIGSPPSGADSAPDYGTPSGITAFPLPGTGPASVADMKGGEGAIRPPASTYVPQQAPSQDSVDQQQKSHHTVSIYDVVKPAVLVSFLRQQPGINAELNNNQAITVTDTTGSSYGVTSGQLLTILQLMKNPTMGYSASIDLSRIGTRSAQQLLNTGALAQAQAPKSTNNAASSDSPAAPAAQPEGNAATAQAIEGGASDRAASDKQPSDSQPETPWDGSASF